jgi:hypothetical protein
MNRVPAPLVCCFWVLALIAATSPAWRLLLLGNNPTLDQLLQMRCFGF